MRDAATVLGIIRERGRRRLPLEDVYRQLFNPALYLLAYGKLATNVGALTPSTTDDTADGMSLKKIQAIITRLRQERYRWTPVRRTYIEKSHSTKQRPLGIPTWSDKLLQEVIRLILEAYYEPQFSVHSHGFRPGRGCGTALRAIYRTWKGTTWFIEGDISACFDSLDHRILLSILREDIHDNRFLRLVANLLKAGYLERWAYHRTLSGTPQGGVVSPVLSNIYLDRLDRYVTTILLPEHNRGLRRRSNPTYTRLEASKRRARKAGRQAEVRRLDKEQHATPSILTADPDYRRLRYIRYADDFLLGFTGPRSEAEAIKTAIGTFLRDTLKLELSPTKTLITHGRTAAARFLGYEVYVQQADRKHTRGMRATNGVIGLRVPKDRLRDLRKRYMAHGKPIHRTELLDDTAYTIVRRYAMEYQGYAGYYRMATNLHRLGTLKWVMETSLTKTLAAKLGISVRTVYRRYQARAADRKVLRAEVAREGKAPLVAIWTRTDLVRDIGADLDDSPPLRLWGRRTELVQRLLAETCELCGAQERIEVHHIRALRDLTQPGRAERPIWLQVMAARRRKTLVVCHACHTGITHGKSRRRSTETPRTTGEPDEPKASCPVRRGADGKVPA